MTAPDTVTDLQRVAVAYAGAKDAMDAMAYLLTQERLATKHAETQAMAAGSEAVRRTWNEQARASLDHADDLAGSLAARIAAWRGALFDLQAAAAAVVGARPHERCTRLASRLQGAATAFAAAKATLDGHQPPFSGVAYAGLVANWRGHLQDLDSAARAYAGGKPAQPKEGQPV